MTRLEQGKIKQRFQDALPQVVRSELHRNFRFVFYIAGIQTQKTRAFPVKQAETPKALIWLRFPR